MTTQGQRDPLPAGFQDALTSRSERGGGGRRIALWCALAGVAAGGAWLVLELGSGGLLPGLHHTAGHPAEAAQASGAPSQPLTEAQAFTVDHYFPAQKAIENGGFKAKRTGGRSGADCAETLEGKSHELLKDTGCQGYLAVSYTRADLQVLSSVTIYRFADQPTADRAFQALNGNPAAVVFVQPDGPSPGETPGNAKPVTKVAEVGHYVTVTGSRSADSHADAKAEQELGEATREVGYAARLPFLWM